MHRIPQNVMGGAKGYSGVREPHEGPVMISVYDGTLRLTQVSMISLRRRASFGDFDEKFSSSCTEKDISSPSRYAMTIAMAV